MDIALEHEREKFTKKEERFSPFSFPWITKKPPQLFPSSLFARCTFLCLLDTLKSLLFSFKTLAQKRSHFLFSFLPLFSRGKLLNKSQSFWRRRGGFFGGGKRRRVGWWRLNRRKNRSEECWSLFVGQFWGCFIGATFCILGSGFQEGIKKGFYCRKRKKNFWYSFSYFFTI